MKLTQEKEDGTNERKFIKSQVERRRRERMNRSLERLRSMLLQEPQQLGGTQRRVEKAEILEHTVLFLQGIAKGDGARAEGGDGGRKHSFQDGISTCLHRAAQFLGPDGKGLWLGAALDASVAARFSRSDSNPEGAPRRTEGCPSSSLPHSKSILQMLRQKSKHGLHARAFGASGRAPAGQGLSRAPQQAQRQDQLESRVERRARKQSPSQSRPIDQALWRPWP